MIRVAIRGDGIAAACCIHLLRQAGIPVTWERVDRPRLPVILLSGSAIALIDDVFGAIDGWGTLPRIRRRVVAWGPDANSAPVEHTGVVVSEQSLLDRISTRLLPDQQTAQPRTTGEWTILAALPLPSGTQEHHFGSRHASATAVTLTKECDPSACFVESLESGWLFLIPNQLTTGYLLTVGGPPADLLKQSHLIARQVSELGPSAGEFPAHPRLRWPLCGTGWLACGSAAVAFDPLCGDGTAHAIREAILAAAVLQSIHKGAEPGPLLAHYQARMAAGLARHLLLCEEFYRAVPGAWWESQYRSVRQGAEWCANEVGGLPRFRYQLNGFELQCVPLGTS